MITLKNTRDNAPKYIKITSDCGRDDLYQLDRGLTENSRSLQENESIYTHSNTGDSAIVSLRTSPKGGRSIPYVDLVHQLGIANVSAISASEYSMNIQPSISMGQP